MVQRKRATGLWKPDFRFSLLIAGIFFAALFPFLATAPQSGDGAELVLNLQTRGVLHPPGFPVQYWLMRLWSLFPFQSDAWSLSLFSLVCHCGAIFFVAESVRKLGGSGFARLIAAGVFGVYPPTCYQGLQPEVFGLTHLLMSSVLYQLAYFWGIEKKSIKNSSFVWIGAVAGLALSQHLIAFMVLPAAAGSVTLLVQNKTGRAKRIGISVVSLMAVVLLSYLSLLLIQSEAVWPDWGKLASLKDWIRHVTRAEYGSFRLHAFEEGFIHRGIQHFAREVVAYTEWFAFVPFFVLGMRDLYEGKGSANEFLLRALFGSLALGLFFITLTQVTTPGEGPWDLMQAQAVLERFHGGVILIWALLAGLGFDAAIRMTKQPMIRGGLITFSLVAVLILAKVHWNRSNAGEDNIADVYRKVLGASLPEEAIYIAVNDLEVFYGAEKEGKIRYPIAADLLSLPWYVQQVIPKIEPRLAASGAHPGGVGAHVQAAFESGLLVASTAINVFPSGYSKNLLVYGPFILLHKSFGTEEFRGKTEGKTFEVAQRICPYLKQLKEIPEEGHGHLRPLLQNVIRGFTSASVYLAHQNESNASFAAKSVVDSLTRGDRPQEWIDACDAFLKPIGKKP